MEHKSLEHSSFGAWDDVATWKWPRWPSELSGTPHWNLVAPAVICWPSSYTEKALLHSVHAASTKSASLSGEYYWEPMMVTSRWSLWIYFSDLNQDPPSVWSVAVAMTGKSLAGDASGQGNIWKLQMSPVVFQALATLLALGHHSVFEVNIFC